MSRCTGHCCRRVIIQFSPYELARCLQGLRNGVKEFTLDNGEVHVHNYALEELTKVCDMVLWLGTSDVDPADGARLLTQDGARRFEHNYTCRHFDPVSGDCLNYANRPRMCSEYPFRQACRYTACTADCALSKQMRVVSEDLDKIKALEVNETLGVDVGHD